ncbi:MAG: hypothetical protein LBK65_01990 [Tannerellaceae bacterium]|jgi:hypothetical protein|nr:hypothetical protein [Tannerellaceae bacterium]
MNIKKKLLLLAIGIITVNASAQVGIGTRQPDSAAMLDIVSTNKGLLIPRVSLQSSKVDLDGKQGQPAGLLIYNTGGKLAAGFYFWNGTEWKILESATAVAPSVSRLDCLRATIEPQSFKAGKPYMGQLIVPYIGGNGGRYSAGSPIPSTGNTGLNISLKAGRLEYGSGHLVYDLVGVPSKDSPVGATFPIQFMGLSCSVTVGVEESATIYSIASVGPLEYTSDNGREGFHRVVTSPDKKFSVRVFIGKGQELSLADIQIRGNIDHDTLMWNGHVSWVGGSKGTGSNKFILPSSNIWYGNGPGENDDNPQTDIDAAWGDRDVYFRAPEQRKYVWTTTDVTDKSTYILTFMMGAPSPSLLATDDNARITKAFLRIEQVHADNL